MSKQWSDTALAAACAAGDPAALSAFEATFGPEIERAAARLDADPATREEFAQKIRERLLVGPTPKIATYCGKGDLLHWLRVVLVRMRRDFARDLGRASGRAAHPLADDEAVASPLDDPEFAHIKAHYGGMLREAVEAAIGGLPADARELLRLSTLEGKTSEQIAATRSVSSATIRRRIAAARDAVWEGTRSEIAARLQVGERDFASIVRVARSELDLSIARLLRG